MAGVTAVGYALCIAVAVVVVWLVSRLRRRRAEPLLPEIQTLLNAVRRRASIAVLLSIGLFVAMFGAGLALPDLMGLPFFLAASLAGSAGLLLYSSLPPQSAPLSAAASREASLIPRTPWTYVSKAARLILLALVALEVAFLVFTGVTSSPDEAGRFRRIAFSTETQTSAASPYAGWFYGIPLLVTTAILMISIAFAFWRVSSTPVLPHSDLRAVDAGWRRASTRILASITVAALLVQFGGACLMSGLSMQSAYFDGIPPIWHTVSGVSAIAGLLMLVGSVVAFTLAALWTLALPEQATRPTRMSPRRADTSPAVAS